MLDDLPLVSLIQHQQISNFFCYDDKKSERRTLELNRAKGQGELKGRFSKESTSACTFEMFVNAESAGV